MKWNRESRPQLMFAGQSEQVARTPCDQGRRERHFAGAVPGGGRRCGGYMRDNWITRLRGTDCEIGVASLPSIWEIQNCCEFGLAIEEGEAL